MKLRLTLSRLILKAKKVETAENGSIIIA